MRVASFAFAGCVGEKGGTPQKAEAKVLFGGAVFYRAGKGPSLPFPHIFHVATGVGQRVRVLTEAAAR